jgi:hypothetical protein
LRFNQTFQNFVSYKSVKNLEKQGIYYLYTMNQLLLIFIGGGLGSITRFSLSKFIQENMDKTFPFGTLGVGCTNFAKNFPQF